MCANVIYILNFHALPEYDSKQSIIHFSWLLILLLDVYSNPCVLKNFP